MSAEPSKEIQPGISAELPKVHSHFPTTRWTLVQRLRQGGEGHQAALDELCALYWYPIHAFLRRQGHPHHDAEDHRDPEQLFARAWASELLEAVRRQLEAEFSAGGRSETFRVLLPFLLGEDPPSYRDVAARLKASETAVRVLVFRMRTRFRECLRETVATTVQDPAGC